jgi:hypothetical protein
MKITKRNIQFFFLGMLTWLLIESVFDWEGAKKSFSEGFNAATGNSKIEQVK